MTAAEDVGEKLSDLHGFGPGEVLDFQFEVLWQMAASAHAYVRGSTVRFYEWLEASEAALPAGPPVWICGDCHVGNLGPVASADGKLAILPAALRIQGRGSARRLDRLTLHLSHQKRRADR